VVDQMRKTAEDLARRQAEGSTLVLEVFVDQNAFWLELCHVLNYFSHTSSGRSRGAGKG
jgi:hypothetical protein